MAPRKPNPVLLSIELPPSYKGTHPFWPKLVGLALASVEQALALAKLKTSRRRVTVVESTVTEAIDDLDELSELDF